MNPARAAAPDPNAVLRRRALRILFWFIAASLLFNALFGDMGLFAGLRQRRHAARLRLEVAGLQQGNARLAAEVRDLRQDPFRIEGLAREDLGLARPGEIIFLFPNEATGMPPPAPEPLPAE